MLSLAAPQLVHVAERDENRGRIILVAGTAGRPAAVRAAAVLARAFSARLECLEIVSPDLLVLSTHSFARQIAFSGQIAPLERSETSARLNDANALSRRLIESELARSATPVTWSAAGATMADAIAEACSREGPWNIAIAGETVQPIQSAAFVQNFSRSIGITGLACTGPRADDGAGGPITLVVEDAPRLPAMLRTAERLASALASKPDAPQPIALVLSAATQRERDALAERADALAKTGFTESGVAIAIAEPKTRHGTPAEMAEAVRRLDPRWLIMRGTTDTGACHEAVPAVLGVARGPVLLIR